MATLTELTSIPLADLVQGGTHVRSVTLASWIFLVWDYGIFHPLSLPIALLIFCSRDFRPGGGFILGELGEPVASTGSDYVISGEEWLELGQGTSIN